MHGPETARNMSVKAFIIALMISWEFEILTLAQLNTENAERDRNKVTKFLKAWQSRTGLSMPYLKMASVLEVGREQTFKFQNDPGDSVSETIFKSHVCSVDQSWDSKRGHGDSKQRNNFEEILEGSKTATWQYLRHQRNGVVVSDVYQPLFKCDNEIIFIKFSMTRHSDPQLVIKTKRADSLTPNQCRCIKRRHGSSQLLRIHFKDCYVHHWIQGKRKYYSVKVHYFDRLLMRNMSGIASCHAAILPHIMPSTGPSPEVLCGKSYMIVKLPAKRVINTKLLRLPWLGITPVFWKDQHTVFVKIKHSAVEDSPLQLDYLDVTGKAQTVTVSCVQHKLHYKRVVRRRIQDPSDTVTSVSFKPTTAPVNTYTDSNNSAIFDFGWGFLDIPVPYLPVVTTTDSLQSTRDIKASTIPQIKQTAVTEMHVDFASRFTSTVSTRGITSPKALFVEVTSISTSLMGTSTTSEAISMQSVTAGEVAEDAENIVPVAIATSIYTKSTETPLVSTTATTLETSTAAITTEAPYSLEISAAKSESVSTTPVQSPITSEISTALPANMMVSTTYVPNTISTESTSLAFPYTEAKTSTTHSGSMAKIVLGKSSSALTTTVAPASAEIKFAATTPVKTTVVSSSATSTERIAFGTTPSVGIIWDTTTLSKKVPFSTKATLAEKITSLTTPSVNITGIELETSMPVTTAGEGTSAENMSVFRLPSETIPVETSNVAEMASIAPISSEEITSENTFLADPCTGADDSTGLLGFSDIPLVPCLPDVTTPEAIDRQESVQVVGTTPIPQVKQTAVTDAHIEIATRLTTVSEMSFLGPMSSDEITSETPPLADTYTGNKVSFGWGISDIPSVPYLPDITSSETIGSLQSTQVVRIPQTKQTAVTDAHIEVGSKLTTLSEITSLAQLPSKEITPFATNPEATTLDKTVIVSTIPFETIPVQIATSSFMNTLPFTTTKQIIFEKTHISSDPSTTMAGGEAVTISPAPITLEMSISAMTTSPTIDETTSVSTTPFASTPEAPTPAESTFVSTTPINTTIVVEMAESLFITPLPTTTTEQLIFENNPSIITRSILLDTSTTTTKAETSLTSEMTLLPTSSVETNTTSEAISMQPVTTGEVATTKTMLLSRSDAETFIPVAIEATFTMSTEKTPLGNTTAAGLETSTAATTEAPFSPEISAAMSVSISTTPVQLPINAEISTTLPATLMVSTKGVESTSLTEASSPELASTDAKTSRTTPSDSTADIVLWKSTPARTTTVIPTLAEIKYVTTTSVKTTVAPSPVAASTERITFEMTPSVGNVLDITTPVLTTGIVLETSTPAMTIAEAATSAQTMSVSTLSSETAIVETSDAAQMVSVALMSSDEITSEATLSADTFSIAASSAEAMTTGITLEMSTSATTTSPTIDETTSVATTPFASTPEAPTLAESIFVFTTPINTTIVVEMATSSFITALPTTTTEQLIFENNPSIITRGIVLDTSTTMTWAETSLTSEMTLLPTSSVKTSTTLEAISMQSVTTGEEATTKTMLVSTSDAETLAIEGTSIYTMSTEKTPLAGTTAAGLETSTAAITEAPSSPEIPAAMSVSISTTPVQLPITAEISTTLPATLTVSTKGVESTSLTEASSPELTSTDAKTSRTIPSDSTADIVFWKSCKDNYCSTNFS